MRPESPTASNEDGAALATSSFCTETFQRPSRSLYTQHKSNRHRTTWAIKVNGRREDVRVGDECIFYTLKHFYNGRGLLSELDEKIGCFLSAIIADVLKNDAGQNVQSIMRFLQIVILIDAGNFFPRRNTIDPSGICLDSIPVLRVCPHQHWPLLSCDK